MRARGMVARALAGLLPLLLLSGCGADHDADCAGGSAAAGSFSPRLVDPASLAVDATGRHLLAACLEGTCRWDTTTGAYEATDRQRYLAVTTDLTTYARHEACTALRLVSGSRERTLRGLPDKAVIEGSAAKDVVFSRDGTMVAASDGSGHVLVWSVRTGRLRSRTEHVGATLLAFSPDGARLAVVTRHGVELIAPATGRVDGRLTGSGRGPAAWSPDGRWVVAAAPNGSARLWRTSDLAVAATLTGHPLSSLAFAPDSRTVAVTDRDYPGVNVWAPEALGGSGALHVFPAPTHPQDGAVFSPDGRRLYTASYEAGITAWDVASGRPVSGFANPTLP